MNLDAEQGELIGHDPMEEVRAIFAVLSKPDGDEANNNFITLAKLHNACQEFEVPLPFCTLPLHVSHRFVHPHSGFLC